MKARIDKLAALGTSVVAFSGGEPMLHPDLDDLIRHIRGRGMMAGLITNGYFLVPKRIEALNDAGLDFLQISIDNVEPDEVSKKSLRVLDKKLQDLKAYATFDININSVVGGGIKNPADARTINERARALGFSTSIGIIHDGLGQMKALGQPNARSTTRCLRRSTGRGRSSRTCIRASAGSRTTWPTASRTNGDAGRERATSTSAKRAWSTTARSSAAIRACRSRATPSTISGGSLPRRSRARRSARSAASIACRRWTSGGARRIWSHRSTFRAQNF